MAHLDQLTDLELIDRFLESSFPDPAVLRRIERRGLYRFINRLPGTPAQKKATARARYVEAGRYLGDDPVINQISEHVERLKNLKAEMAKVEPTETNHLSELAQDIIHHCKLIEWLLKE